MSVLPVYFTGEPAEENIEHLPGVSESLIEAHEEAAEKSLILTLIIGGAAVLALLGPQKPGFQKYVNLLLILVTAIAVGSLGYTANLGGKIRHPEFHEKSNEVP